VQLSTELSADLDAEQTRTEKAIASAEARDAERVAELAAERAKTEKASGALAARCAGGRARQALVAPAGGALAGYEKRAMIESILRLPAASFLMNSPRNCTGDGLTVSVTDPMESSETPFAFAKSSRAPKKMPFG
jgi:hypothetical protein